MTEFRGLRAGSAGCLTLQPTSIDADVDLLFGTSRVWESVIPYQVTRHVKKVQAADVLSSNLRAECRRLGLPEPQVSSFDLRGVSGVGLVGSARLTFAVAVNGPILLGKNRHLGGGLFARNRQGES
jgi:CRISPR-associated protein Csb2